MVTDLGNPEKDGNVKECKGKPQFGEEVECRYDRERKRESVGVLKVRTITTCNLCYIYYSQFYKYYSSIERTN